MFLCVFFVYQYNITDLFFEQSQKIDHFLSVFIFDTLTYFAVLHSKSYSRFSSIPLLHNRHTYKYVLVLVYIRYIY